MKARNSKKETEQNLMIDMDPAIREAFLASTNVSSKSQINEAITCPL